jgi:hypothetical protein
MSQEPYEHKDRAADVPTDVPIMSRKPQQKCQATPADRTAGGGADPPAPHPSPDISDRGKIITKGLTEQNFSDSSGIPRSRLKIFRKEFLDGGLRLESRERLCDLYGRGSG